MNAMVRPPTVTPSAASAATEPVTAESLGWQLRAALPPLRLHSVSLYDREANVLWLSEGALGPDEHSLVMDAAEALSADVSQACHEHGMEDGRVAIFLPVRAPKGDLVGLSMILADLKSVGDGVLERMVTPQVRTIMQKIAVLLRGSVGKAGTETVPILDMTPEPAVERAAPVARAAKAPPARPAPQPAAAELLTPEAVDDILEFELTPNVPRAEAHTVPTLSPPVEESGSESITQEIFILSLDPVDGQSDAAATSAPAASAAALLPTAPVDTIATIPAAPSAAATIAQAAPAASSASSASAALATPAASGASGALAAPAARSNSTSQVLALSTTGSTNLASPGTTANSKALAPGMSTGTSRVLSSSDSANTLLEVQPYVKLRAGGRSRRYEVLVRSSGRDSAALDAHALQRLLSWLSVNRGAWNLEPTTFTLNLSITTLEDEKFPQNVATALKSHGISPETIGFEIAEPLCMQRRAQVERFINLCDKIGCFVVIDDFSFDSSVLPLLRSKALRLVKIDPKLTGAALKDKMAQALVVAIAQAVKVLGIHCSAKRVDSQGAMQWLTAIGCDFAQGPMVSALQSLDSLVPNAASGGPGKSS